MLRNKMMFSEGKVATVCRYNNNILDIFFSYHLRSRGERIILFSRNIIITCAAYSHIIHPNFVKALGLRRRHYQTVMRFRVRDVVLLIIIMRSI